MKSKPFVMVLLALCAAIVTPAQPQNKATVTVFVRGAGLHPGSDKAQSMPIETRFAQALATEMNAQSYTSTATFMTPTMQYPSVDHPYVVLDCYSEPINDHTIVMNTTILGHFANEKGNFRYFGTAVSIIDTNLTGGIGASQDPEVPISLTAAVEHARLFFEKEVGLAQ